MSGKKDEKLVLVAARFSPAVRKTLKAMAVEEDTSTQALLEEALRNLFEAKGKNWPDD